jgi:uncharacterized membrane-anchored protein YhcB (DUF1043 family)
MNEILADTKTVLLWLFGTIGTLLGILGAVALSILKGHVKRIDKLEAESVRRAEFDQFRADMREEHQDNIRRLDEIKAETTGTNKRLDELMMRGFGRGP